MSTELHATGTLRRDIRRVLFKEVLIGVVLNALVFPFIIWLLDVKPPAAFDGPGGVVASLAKATAFSVFLMTVILTLVWRVQAQAGKGTAASVGSRVLSWSRFVPRNVIGRALLFVLAAMVTLLPLGVAVCDWFDLYPMTKQGFALVNVCYGALVGTVVTPFITLVAIAEQQAAGDKTGK